MFLYPCWISGVCIFEAPKIHRPDLCFCFLNIWNLPNDVMSTAHVQELERLDVPAQLPCLDQILSLHSCIYPQSLSCSFACRQKSLDRSRWSHMWLKSDARWSLLPLQSADIFMNMLDCLLSPIPMCHAPWHHLVDFVWKLETRASSWHVLQSTAMACTASPRCFVDCLFQWQCFLGCCPVPILIIAGPDGFHLSEDGAVLITGEKVGAHYTERDTLNDLQCLWFIRQNHDTLGQHRPVHWLVSHHHFVAPHDYHHDLQVAQQPSLVSLRSVVCILECKGLKSTAMATMLAVLEADCNSDSIFWNGRHAMVLGNKQCAWGCWTCWCRGFWDPFVIHRCWGWFQMILVAGDAAGGMFGRSPYLEAGQHLAFSCGNHNVCVLHAAEMIWFDVICCEFRSLVKLKGFRNDFLPNAFKNEFWTIQSPRLLRSKRLQSHFAQGPLPSSFCKHEHAAGLKSPKDFVFQNLENSIGFSLEACGAVSKPICFTTLGL